MAGAGVQLAGTNQRGRAKVILPISAAEHIDGSHNIVITKKSHLAVTIRIIWGGAEVRIFCVSAYEQCLTDGVRAEILNRGRNI